MVFDNSISPAVLLVAMVTTTLTLVIISHRLRAAGKRNQDLLNKLNGIKGLIWAHLIVTIAISFRITLIAFYAAESFPIFDKVIVIAVFVILGLLWPTYFFFLGGGKIKLKF